MLKNKIIIRNGDKLLCNNKHVICEAVRDIQVGDKLKKDDFIFDSKQKPPIIGKPLNKCFCGAEWLEGNPKSIRPTLIESK